MLAFVDGAVDKNRRRDQGGAGFGGAGVVLVKTDGGLATSYRVVGVPFWPHSMFISNNTMEIMAVQAACNILEPEILAGKDVHIWSDSTYAKGMLSFGTSWTAKENQALVEYIRRTTARHNILIHHVKGHAGFAWNELADTAAVKAVEYRRGFDREFQCLVHHVCFQCSKFPCKKPDYRNFGLKSSKLLETYREGIKCADFDRRKVEGLEDAW
jgi:ribonuclease HI